MLSWLTENYGTLLTVAAGVVASASVLLHVIAPLTKNTKDDAWLARVDWLLQKLSLNKPDAK